MKVSLKYLKDSRLNRVVGTYIPRRTVGFSASMRMARPQVLFVQDSNLTVVRGCQLGRNNQDDFCKCSNLKALLRFSILFLKVTSYRLQACRHQIDEKNS